MLDKEKKIFEERTALAITKNYMGLEGKFGTILKYLGKPVIEQGSANFETTEWLNLYEEDDDGLPTEDPDAPITEIGKMFDGLKFGYQIEITYMKDGMVPVKKNEYETTHEPAMKVLKVFWKGYQVYVEADGELYVFKPSEEWEDVINKIYDSARKLQISYRQDAMIEMQEDMTKKKLSFLERLRERWGI